MQGLVLSRYFNGNLKRLAQVRPRCNMANEVNFLGFDKESAECSLKKFEIIFVIYILTKFEPLKKKYFKHEKGAIEPSDNNSQKNESKYFNKILKLDHRSLVLGKIKERLTSKNKHFKRFIQKCDLKLSDQNAIFNRTITFGNDVDVDNTEVSKDDLLDGTGYVGDIDYEKEYFKNLNKNGISNVTSNTNNALKGVDIDWIPPRSPHNLIEEILYHDPWALLVATIFLNKTSCALARPYLFWFLVENPGPMSVMDRFPKDLEKYFEKLGLQQSKAVQIWRMTHDYLHKNWKKPSDLYGIGNYGESAYRIFCQGDLSVEPQDRFLIIYKEWYKKVLRNCS